jgi:hypothetical protein
MVRRRPPPSMLEYGVATLMNLLILGKRLNLLVEAKIFSYPCWVAGWGGYIART